MRSRHGLKYELSTFRKNDVVEDTCIVQCQSHFDSCWIVGSLGVDLAADQVQRTVEMTMWVLEIWTSGLDEMVASV